MPIYLYNPLILCKRFSVIFGSKTLCLPATTPPQIPARVPELSEQQFRPGERSARQHPQRGLANICVWFWSTRRETWCQAMPSLAEGAASLSAHPVLPAIFYDTESISLAWRFGDIQFIGPAITTIRGCPASIRPRECRKISKNWAGLAVDLNSIHHTKHHQYVDLLPF